MSSYEMLPEDEIDEIQAKAACWDQWVADVQRGVGMPIESSEDFYDDCARFIKSNLERHELPGVF